jgi:putative membrane protein
MYYTNYYWGMNFIWWILWIAMIIWVFAIPFDIPGQRSRRNTPLDILKKRYAAGQIDIEEYNEKKANILKS